MTEKEYAKDMAGGEKSVLKLRSRYLHCGWIGIVDCHDELSSVDIAVSLSNSEKE